MRGVYVLDASAVLFVLAAAFGLFNHHVLRLPFTIGLLASGLLASLAMLAVDALIPGFGLAAATREAIQQIDFANVILYGMLSVLLFAGALHVDLETVFDRRAPILLLATMGILLSTAVAASLAYLVFGALGLDVHWRWCLVFGALISPTDPIAVLGIMRQAGAPADLETKVVGESLFNDGVGVVLFLALLGFAAGAEGGGDPVTLGSVGTLLVQEIVGGILLGLGLGYAAYRALATLDEANLEILISVATILGINLVATRLHVSGPLAAVVAGLMLGNKGRYLAMSDSTREHLDIVWYFIDEALNAILFLLIGLEVFAIESDGATILAALVLIPLVLTARAIGVALPLRLLRRQGGFPTGTTRVLIWGGLKGGVSVALAMKLPPSEARDVLLTAAYATVVFSILVQGLTVGPLIRRFFGRPEAAAASK